jgi:hypothetical protein
LPTGAGLNPARPLARRLPPAAVPAASASQLSAQRRKRSAAVASREAAEQAGLLAQRFGRDGRESLDHVPRLPWGRVAVSR